ncbi:MAG: hypothetical protein AVDCRST_MAG69-737, partial [uncultured Solirubrobacteraceae bacterium]
GHPGPPPLPSGHHQAPSGPAPGGRGPAPIDARADADRAGLRLHAPCTAPGRPGRVGDAGDVPISRRVGRAHAPAIRDRGQPAPRGPAPRAVGPTPARRPL